MISYEPFFRTMHDKGITEYSLIFKHGMSANTIHRIKHGMPINAKHWTSCVTFSSVMLMESLCMKKQPAKRQDEPLKIYTIRHGKREE